MKKFAIFTILFLLCFYTGTGLFLPKTAILHAEENKESYGCILSHDVYLYAEENDTSGLFLIPYTYYVKVLNAGIEYCYVQYSTDEAPFQAVYGYCKTEELNFVDFTPNRPFLYYTLDVTYRLEDYPEVFQDGLVFSSVTLTYAYYGDYTVGSTTYCYVALDGKTGYLPKTMDISYELNEDYISGAGNENENANGSTAFPAGQMVLAVLLSLLALGVIYCLFRPKTAPTYEPLEEFEG